jgi:predicted transcriptional regulator
VKSVLISIQPKWCELIASGKKTVEVRKTKPKLKTPFKVYIYCTANKQGAHDLFETHATDGKIRKANSKVIGEFVCDDIGEFKVFENGSVQYWNYHELGKTCLTYDELANYIGRNKDGYGWHISNLVIYDKPRELKKFRYYNASVMVENGFILPTHEITRPPQSWCYVENEVQGE